MRRKPGRQLRMPHATDATFYLPLSDPLLEEVLDGRQPLADALAGLAVPQLAALMVLHCLGEGKPVPAPGDMLASLIALGNRWVRQAGLPAFVGEILGALDREGLRAGREQLRQCGIGLLVHDDLAHRSYLTAEGEWDGGFPPRYREMLQRKVRRLVLPGGELRTLTPEQAQVYCEAEAHSDEHLHVQGYAGIGKSMLVTSLLGMLVAKGAVIALVAERKGQLAALLARTGQVEGVRAMTFEGLMDEVIPADLTDPSYRRMRRRDSSHAMLADETLARHLGVHASGGVSPAGIVRIVRSTVSAFCRSGAAEIGVEHIPRSAPVLDPSTRLLVLHHATELWKTTVLPTSREFRPPLRDYHRIKWAALKGWRIPDKYTHVLMDECHDLPQALLQLVEASAQAVITLGDEYQSLKVRAQHRSPAVRERRLTVSVRSGRLIEGIVNPIIAAHPGRTKLPFHGSPVRQLTVHYYDRAEVPHGAVLLLVNDEWGLFEWAQRLAEKGDFELLSSAPRLGMFVSDCIELHRHGIRPRHGALYRHGSWESLAAAHGDNAGFRRIDRMLAKGYTAKDWARTLERAKGGARAPLLGMVEDVRNREFGSVMLAPDVADWAWSTRQSERAEAGSAIYVAVTRARETLYLPRRLEAWLKDLQPG
jgi:hypothetical protein